MAKKKDPLISPFFKTAKNLGIRTAIAYKVADAKYVLSSYENERYFQRLKREQNKINYYAENRAKNDVKKEDKTEQETEKKRDAEMNMPMSAELEQSLMERDVIAFRIGHVLKNTCEIFKYIEFITCDGQMVFIYDDFEGYQEFFKEFKNRFSVEKNYAHTYSISATDEQNMYFFRYFMTREEYGFCTLLGEEETDKYGDTHYFFSPLDKVIEWTALKPQIPQFHDVTIDIRRSNVSSIQYILKVETLIVPSLKDFWYKMKIKDGCNDEEVIRCADITIANYSERIKLLLEGNVGELVGNEMTKLYDYYMMVKAALQDAKVAFMNQRQQEEKAEETQNANPNGDWGEKGEQEVEYALKWLPQGYMVVKRDCTSKYGKDVILLKDDTIAEEAQEFDHIVIGAQGIFLIETKYYKGKISIDANGNWIREDANGNRKGVKNPIQQIDRHHLLLERILGMDEIHDIICIAHDEAIIEGIENSAVPIVKVDMLARYIKEYKAERQFSEEEKMQMIEKINNHKVEKKDE